MFEEARRGGDHLGRGADRLDCSCRVKQVDMQSMRYFVLSPGRHCYFRVLPWGAFRKKLVRSGREEHHLQGDRYARGEDVGYEEFLVTPPYLSRPAQAGSGPEKLASLFLVCFWKVGSESLFELLCSHHFHDFGLCVFHGSCGEPNSHKE